LASSSAFSIAPIAWATTPPAAGRVAAKSSALFLLYDVTAKPPDRQRHHVSAFHHNLVELTGSSGEIRKVANSFKAFYVKVQDERSEDYSIDHTAVIYLMGRNGEYLGFMPPQTNPDRLTEVLRKNLSK
jgi:protein SCO1/2